jgi:hypothetical protein
MLTGKKTFKLKKILAGLLSGLILLALTGCSGVFYIPGASYGYYVWEEEGNIFIEWSADRKDSEFEGEISTDGRITSHELKEWEDEDTIRVAEEEIKFMAVLSSEDYSDGFSFSLEDYSYLEFDLRINDGYELSRINLGGFLETPGDNIFRIEKDYFEKLQKKPWYQKRPFSEFFYKLFSNKYFTFLYLFILGIIIIEILRITVFDRRKRKLLWIVVSCTVLVAVEISVYFILKFLVS